MNKNFVASTVIIALMFIAMYGVTSPDVDADAGKDSSNFLKKFSNKFNLNENEVSSFMADIRADRFADRQSAFEDHLSKAVDNGHLDENKKQELLGMRGMHMAEVDFYVNLTVDERQDMMQDHYNQMKIWADENGVDFSSVGYLI